MKSFGVRLTAGVITILFGAYAAAVAQKDKQNSSESWMAQPPSLGQPAAPIATMGGESWINQPSADSVQSPQALLTPGAIQLVEHTEPIQESASTGFDLSSLPSGFGDSPAATDDSADVPEMTVPGMTVPTPDWARGPERNPSQETENLAPTFKPDFAPQQVSEKSLAGSAVAEPATAMTLPQDAMNAGAPQRDTTPSESPQPFAALPELQLTNPPALNLSSGQGPEQGPTGQQDPLRAVADVPPTPTTALDANPQNFLRGSDSSGNVLRGGMPNASSANDEALANEPIVPTHFNQLPTNPLTQNALAQNALAQNAPGFGRPAQQFNQPALAPLNPTGLGTPQIPQPMENRLPGNHLPMANSLAPPNLNTAPPARIASLPNSLPGRGTPDYAPAGYAQPVAAASGDPSAAIDTPGDRSLDGIQSPSVVIQKRAPSEVKVGKPASFVIQVQNVGSAEALDVKIHDRIPAGMRLIDASPKPIVQGTELLWQLGAMRAGDERTVTMQLIPEQEGELGSVARVSFEAAASVRTMSTRPELKIVQRAPETVMIGQQLEIELEVSNPGTGEAVGVVLQEDVPEGLEHPRGRQLDNSLGNLAPGELRRQVLRLRAVAPGIVQNTIRLTGEDGLTAEHTVTVQIVAPELKVELAGPSRKFLERQATYQLNLANVGTADATNVQIAVHLDRGFSFVSAGNEGTYDSSQHTVFWELMQLPAGGTGSVPLTLLPIEEGTQSITVDARADLGVVAKSERTLTVEGFAELNFSITNPGGPIELGAESTYEIRVTNSGSKPDNNVRVQLQLPAGLELLQSDSQYQGDNRGLLEFQVKSQLMPGAEVVHRIRVRGVAPGTHLVKAIVVSDQSTVPVTKEESTMVYADQ